MIIIIIIIIIIIYFKAVITIVEATYSLPSGCQSGSPSPFDTYHRIHIYRSFIMLKRNILQINMLIASMFFDVF
jgi:hypothetical protein